MNRNTRLLVLAKETEQAYQVWRNHPDDIVYQREYELAKARLDSEIKQCKDASYLNHHH
jgi:hypothetical protein